SFRASGGIGVVGRQLRELDQDVAGSRWVDERDPRAAVADARRLVPDRDALGPELGERAVDVLHLEADVKEPRALLGDPAGHARLRPLALEELDVGLADG